MLPEITCPRCRGTGFAEIGQKCPDCYGTGHLNATASRKAKCFSCKGTGHSEYSPSGLCPDCHGTGEMNC